jgi:hypothetical protein
MPNRRRRSRFIQTEIMVGFPELTAERRRAITGAPAAQLR